MKYEISDRRLSPEDMSFYAAVNKRRRLTPTGELLEVLDDNGRHIATTVVFTGMFTAYGALRDCGDHYIAAQYNRYDRINKDTMRVTKDVPDR